MKAISLWEPWATAIAIGAKSIETRGWHTSYRGPLAIHAAKTKEHGVIIYDSEVRPIFATSGIMQISDLAFGCVVATCTLKACWQTEHVVGGISEQEKLFGNYARGRFAWVLEEVRRLPTPIPARGAQGFWDWDGGPSQLASSDLLLPGIETNP